MKTGSCLCGGVSFEIRGPLRPVDGTTELIIEGHIYCADKGDYYDILDGDYQKPQGS